MELKQGTLLQGGKYRIEKVLGQGTFGITYLAEHTLLSSKVAIKEFFMKDVNSRGEDGSTILGMTEGSLSYNYVQKFRKEAVNLSHMHHPNIVRVTDCFNENGTCYYVMDYIDGENLNDYVKHTPLSEAEAVEMIKAVASALDYMHNDEKMLHLDLKPGNIMHRSRDGHIFLIDFGLSKHYDNNGQPETSTTIGLGTAGYAPMEQGSQTMKGEFRPTIDVYALGATLYKLLTRETPPEASVVFNDDEALESSLKAHGVSQKTLQAIIKAMEPKVKARTQSVADFLISVTSDSNQIPTDETQIAEDSEKTQIFEKQEETQLPDESEATVTTPLSTPPEFHEETSLPTEENNDNNENNDNSNKNIGIVIAIIVILVFLALIVGKGCNKGAGSAATWDSIADTTAVADTAAADTAAAPAEAVAPAEETKPSRYAEIQKVWWEDETIDGEMRFKIHVKFKLVGCKKTKCDVTAYFYYPNGNDMKDIDNNYSNTSDNQVCTWKYFTPDSDDKLYKDFTLVIPYNQIHDYEDKGNWKFSISICGGSNSELLVSSEKY